VNGAVAWQGPAGQLAADVAMQRRLLGVTQAPGSLPISAPA
jgi:hypothetical protein